MKLLSLLLGLVSLFTLGCQRGEPTGELSGIVYSNDEPVSDCVIGLYNSSTRRTTGGQVDGDGKFLVKRVPLGEYQVFFGRKPTNSAENPPFDERIPLKYRDHQRSEFSVVIEEGANTADFKMNR